LTKTRSTRWGRPATSTKYTTSLRWLSVRVSVTTTTTKTQSSFVLLLLAARCAFAILLWCLLDKDREKILPDKCFHLKLSSDIDRKYNGRKKVNKHFIRDNLKESLPSLVSVPLFLSQPTTLKFHLLLQV